MGAPESNAGDDFHFWWAASRALALIQPGTEGRLLTVEGLSHFDGPDDQYEVVDVAEYLGGATFDDATRVLVSQLKYSTRHPTRSWTAAQISRKRTRRQSGGKSERPRSVIADLAGTYRQLVEQYGRDAVLRKVRIRLVSNQPADPLLTAAISAAARWIHEQGRPVRRADLLKALQANQATVVRTLATAVGDGLTSTAFCDFLTVLDLSLLGALDRAALTRQVRAATVQMSPGGGPDPSWRLFHLVREQAMPESRRQGITAHDVLAALDVGDRSDLYPVPPRFVELPDPLPAPSAPQLAQAVMAHRGGTIVAKGAAGAGKTTAIRQVAAHLPADSTVVLYDCYGAGEYLNAGEERHTAQRFVMQVTNDLAQLCGTSLILHPPPMEEDLWRHFAKTLTRAVETLAPDAVLVVAVDAADNAAIAAVERGDSSFLRGLLTVPLPQQVCVVLTARSHRIEMTGAAGRPTVDVVPFDADTSADHLRRYCGDVSPADLSAFHERTGGNPRAQFYVLEQARRNGWDIPHLLEACERTPDALFADLVDSALAGSRVGGRWLAALLALSRPVGIRTLARALEVEPAAVLAFAEGLTPGVEVTEERIQFRDEDFETYVRDQVEPDDVTAAHARLAQLLYTLRASDPDAAAHVADHQFAAGRHNDLLSMVLAEDAPIGIADGFRREQVQGRRLDLAALAAAVTDDGAVAVRIAARACDTASRLNTLSELVETNLDLVARYTDIDLLRTHALRQNQSQWLGPAHMRLAAALARDPERLTSAREALLDAEAWVSRWMADRDGETRDWRLEADDVAAAAEAHYRLDGVEAANAWLRQWRPLRFAHEAATKLAARIAGGLGPDAVLEALHAASAPAAVHPPFLAYATSPTSAPNTGWLAATVETLTSSPPRPQEPAQPWHARLLDAVLRHGRPTDAQSLARRWAGALPTHRWEFHDRGSQGMHRLRCHATLAALRGEHLDIDALVPTSLLPRTDENGRPNDPRQHDRKSWLEALRPLSTVAVLAVQAALGHRVLDAVVEEITTQLDGRLDAAGHRWFKHDAWFRGWAALAAEAAADAGVDASYLDRLADAAPVLVRETAPHVWLDIAGLLAERGVHTDRAADLCLRAAKTIRTAILPAPDRVELLTRAADIANAFAPELGRRLFGQAVDAATGINDDAARLLEVHADLARRATLAASQRNGIAQRLVRAAEDVAPHVTDSRIIPYVEIAAAAAGLDAGIGLSAVSRWDDEDRISWTSTLSATLIGAIDGGEMKVDEGLLLDHLLDDDNTRLRFQLSATERLLAAPGKASAARLALTRATRWLRHHVAAQSQPRLAQMLLNWASTRGLDNAVRAELTAVIALAIPDKSDARRAWSLDWSPTGPPAHLQAMLDAPRTRSWATLRDDVAQFDAAHVYGDQIRDFVLAVAGSAAPTERVDVIAEVAKLPGQHGADTALPVLAELVERWRDWPGVTDQITAALPDLITRWLPTFAWRDDTDTLLGQLRALDDDAPVRRAVLRALPPSRAMLTAYGWRNVATLLGRLCRPADAADALVGLLDDRRTGDHTDQNDAHHGPAEPVVMLLWSAFGHPRREVRWRACHAAHELCLRSESTRAAGLVAAFVGLVGLADLGRYRDRTLYFYRLSADAAALTMLARLAGGRPDLLAPHTTTLVRIATNRDHPHVQIRELARHAALAAAPVAGEGQATMAELLKWANQPVACHAVPYPGPWPNRQISGDRRYRFDQMDTIPYWYEPLARVFGVPVDVIAGRAERWILDRWGGSEDDWMTDARELRDERSWGRMNNGHGAIPPEENLRLYLEYHAMLTVAGELLDERHATCVEQWDDGAEDRWQSWLREHLPVSPHQWLAELRSPVPADTELFGNLPPLDEWQVPRSVDYDRVLGLVDGGLPDLVMVDGHIALHGPDRYARTYVSSALVGPAHAVDLQRALASATYASDWKLPDEGETEFEVDHGTFILRGWVRRTYNTPDTLDQHDPYAYELKPTAPIPGQDFRDTMAVVPGPTGTTLLGHTGSVVARAEQWSDPRGADQHIVSSSGTRVLVDRLSLLRYLKTTGMILIVEVQLGRNRQERGANGYNLPHSRIYLIDGDGRITPD